MKRTKQWKLSRVKGKVLIVGVDVGRLEHTAVLRLSDGEQIRTMKFENTLNGFVRLLNASREACDRHGLERTVMGMEPTGHYWQSLAYWWEDNNGEVVLVNPMHTKRAKEMEDNSPLKSDEKDARVIAGLIAEGKYLECHLPRGLFADLRNLIGQRWRCEKEKSQVTNQLNQVVDRIFPELVRCFSKLTTKSCVELLSRYPTPDKIAEEELSKITVLLKQMSRGRLGKERAEKIQQLARNTIGVKEGVSIVALEVGRLLKNLKTFDEQSQGMEKRIAELLKTAPGAELLLGLKGLGPVTVGTILANTGDLRNYEHPEEVIKLAGLNLFEISSGQRKGILRISKRGRAELRRILYMAALRLVQFCAGFKQYYKGLISRGVKRLVGLVAVMRKILRVVWSMVKKNRPFNPELLKPTALPKVA